jgi:hypothetical protein
MTFFLKQKQLRVRGPVTLETARARSGSSSLTGFTLIEIIVVVSIIMLLTTIMLLYGKTGESQLILFKEQSRLVSALYRSKALSIETFSDANSPCGYGVHFDPPSSYLIFKDMAPASGCKNSDKKYTNSGQTIDEVVDIYIISPEASLVSVPITDVLFIPPDPQTIFQYVNFGDTTNPIPLILKSSGGSASLNVSINSAGQISI